MLRPTRLLALGGLVLVGVLYWKPIHTYEHTQATLQNRAGRGRAGSQAEQRAARRSGSRPVGTGQELVREARRLGFVKPGEQLFIVRGIARVARGDARGTDFG